MKRVLTLGVFLVLIWLIAGAFAAFERGYFSDQDCAAAVDDAQMVVWGPLSYLPDLEYLPGSCVHPTEPNDRRM
ncbi:hypothetical protein [Nocardioides psychrotolerans]|uniref:hypothetical protein n=1 Tax=Nocardioides psychrotolerans TaxID=1005945 RepID=UPI00313787E5